MPEPAHFGVLKRFTIANIDCLDQLEGAGHEAAPSRLPTESDFRLRGVEARALGSGAWSIVPGLSRGSVLSASRALTDEICDGQGGERGRTS